MDQACGIYPYRVFVSYAHEDKTRARKLKDYLVDLGLRVVWDESIRPGERFSDRIRCDISRAHLFVPLLTPVSVERPWVHHETGFAMGLGVPVLPVAMDTVPPAMIGDLQAVVVRASLRPSDLATRLTTRAVSDAVGRATTGPAAYFERITYPEERAKRFVACLDELHSETRGHVMIRQDGALTSFAIPNAPPRDPAWDEREGKQKRTPFSREALWHERQRFEEHVKEAGCRLIIDSSIRFRQDGAAAPRVRKARLGTLLAFLQSMPDDKVEVVAHRRGSEPNITLLGDWVVAVAELSNKPGEGYRHTLFTWHAPTVLDYLREFDAKFATLQAHVDYGGKSSRQWAIDLLQETIEGISPPATPEPSSDLPSEQSAGAPPEAPTDVPPDAPPDPTETPS